MILRRLAILALSLLALPASAAPPVVYHSPNDDGVNPGGPVQVPSLVQTTIHLYIDGGSTASPSDPCFQGTGDEVCAWNLTLAGQSGLSLVSFTPSGAVVSNLSGGVLRANRLDPLTGALGPVKVGDLVVEGFGDLGGRLGAALRERVAAKALPWRLCEDSQGIRSTALGGSEFTAQLSGNTGYVSDPQRLLPRRNVQVVRPEFRFTERFSSAALAAAIREHLALFDLDQSEADVVLAFHWEGAPQYRRIAAFAQGLGEGLAERIARAKPIYVILDADIALNLGALLAERLRREDGSLACDIMVIDGLTLWDFDFIDLGAMRLPSTTVPVTIKSLVFRDVADDARRAERIHHRPIAAFREGENP